MEEVENTVEEQPATHKKKSQNVLILAIIMIVVLLGLAVYKKMSGGTQINGEPVATNTQAANRESLAKQQILFEKKFDQASTDYERQMRQRESGAVVVEGESEYDATIRKLQAELDAAKQQQQPKYHQPQNYQPANPSAGRKTWDEEERDRVRAARYTPANLNLGTKEKGAGAEPAAPGASVLNDAQQRLAHYESLSKGGSKAPTAAGATSGFLSGLPGSQGQLQGNQLDTQSGGSPVVGRAISDQPHGPKVGQYLLPTATVIKAALDQKSISDYTGPYRCRITDDVYDVTKRFILIPKGSKCMGRSMRVTNVNEPIQARMGLNMEWIVLPDGRRISFKSQAMLDREGVNAVEGDVDRHLLAQFLGVAAYALVGSSTDYNTTEEQSYEGEVGAGVREKTGSIAEKYINLVPTITLSYGEPLRIFIEEEMYIYPWRRVGAQYLN